MSTESDLRLRATVSGKPEIVHLRVGLLDYALLDPEGGALGRLCLYPNNGKFLCIYPDFPSV